VSTKLRPQVIEDLKGISKTLRKAINQKDTQGILNIAGNLILFISSHRHDFSKFGLSESVNSVGVGLTSLENSNELNLQESLKSISKVSGIESDFQLLKKKPIRQTIVAIGIKLERDLHNFIKGELAN
jgi:hypothetical protein